MPQIAPTAVVGENVRLADDCLIEDHAILGHGSQEPVEVGSRVVIRAGTIVYSGVRLGAGVRTGHHAVIRSGTIIGDDCMIGTNVVIDGDCVIGDRVKLQSNVYIPTNTRIESDVFIGPCATLTNDKPMAAYSRGIYPRDRLLVGPVVRRGARVGANSTILPEIEIGEDAVVGAGAVVTQDVPARTVVVGVPARPSREVPRDEWVSVDRAAGV